jgi:hypothetical protein
MDLDQQLQKLINEAPKYGVPALIMEYGVVPVLKTYAQQLNYQHYYLRQTLEQNLVVTILSNPDNIVQEKKVIYAFPSVDDAAQFPDSKIDDANIIAQKVDVGEILFQMFASKEIDSIIFIDKPENYQQSKEIYCDKLQQAIQENLKLLIHANSSNNNLA